MLELGKAGTLGVGTGVLPVVRDGVVVATLQASARKEQATAVVGDREWVFRKHEGELVARWAVDAEGTARLRARKTSWLGGWQVELEGAPVEVRTVSGWKTTRRYVVDERAVAVSGWTSGWSPRPTLDAHGSMPLDHAVFLLWVEGLRTGADGGFAGIFGDGGGDGGGGGD